MLVRILLMLRHPPLQRRIRRALDDLDVLVDAEANNSSSAFSLKSGAVDIVIARDEIREARELIAGWEGQGQRPLLVLVTTSEEPGLRSLLRGEGAAAVLGEHDEVAAMRSVLAEVVAQRKQTMLLSLRPHPASRYGTLDDFVAKSPRMSEFVKVVRKIAARDSTVLVLGETGVGKERLAHAFHVESLRANGPFVAINCAGLPEALLESELFGHEAGAFTDARKERRGRFEVAHTGTIFLDEIGDMPLHLQSKLLRVLQEREVERLGGESSILVDVRVIAATNVSLKAAMEAKAFRADLYFRLCVIELEIPPLRDRVEDIPGLVDVFVRKYTEQFGRGALSVSEQAMDVLTRYRWPGNVRELTNVIERAALLVDGETIEVSDLPIDMALQVGSSAAAIQASPAVAGDGDVMGLPSSEHLASLNLPAAREELHAAFERWYLTRLLTETQGAIGESARRAGLDPRSLYEKLKRYEIDKRLFKGP